MDETLYDLIFASGRMFAYTDKPEFRELLEKANIDYEKFVKALTDLSNAILASKYRKHRKDDDV